MCKHCNKNMERIMENKITRENYREQLEIIAKQNGLEVVNTTAGRNGYPIGIMHMLKGFESFEQFQIIASQYPILNHFKLQKKDGWQLWYRQSDYFVGSYLLDEVLNGIQNCWYKTDKLDFINHALLDCFEDFFEYVKEIESVVGQIFLLDKNFRSSDLTFTSVEQALSVWEKNKNILKNLEYAQWTDDNDVECKLSEYIDFYTYNEKIKKYEEWFNWFDKNETNRMLVEDLNSDRIEESEIEICSYYYDTYTYAMALGVSSLSDLEIE